MMLLTIAFRNFVTRFKSVFVLILGVGVPSMLLVGGLALNDSIGRWIERSLSQNFGTADAYVENNRNNPFFKVPLNPQTTGSVKSYEKVLNVLPVSETLGRIKFGGETLDCLVVGLSPEDLRNFVAHEVRLPSKGAIVSKDLAELLNINEDATIAINMGRGNVEFKVTQIGKEGFLNFRGEVLQYPGAVFINKSDFQGGGGLPTRLYLHLAGSPEEHVIFMEELEETLKVDGAAMKAELLNSPANKALGYLTIAFSSFSVVASLILVYIFAQSFVEERNTTMATLRILGMKARHIFVALIVEGSVYLVVSGFLGASMGILLGNFLLRRLRATSSILAVGGFHTGLSRLNFHVAPSTIILGALGGLILPLLIFLWRIRKLAQKPPVTMLRSNEEPQESSSKKSRRLIAGTGSIVMAMILGLIRPDLWIFALLVGIVGTLIVFPSTILSLGFGVFIILVVTVRFTPLEHTTVWEILQRGSAFFVGSWLVFLFLVAPIRKLLSKLMTRRSVSAYLALSYVERHRRNTFIIASMFSLIIFVMLLVLVVPYNIERFVRKKLETGLFGYNFMVIVNPLKLVLGSGELNIAEGLKGPSKVYVAEFNGEPIAFVDEAFLQHAVVPIEKNTEWRQRLLEPGAVVVGYLLENEAMPSKVTGKVKSPFKLGRSEELSLEVIDTFDMRQLMVPVKYVASIKSLPKDVKAIPVLLSKVEPTRTETVKDFYRERFDFPIYITEEMNRVFSGIDLLVQTGVSLLYFGLISGFSGIAFHALRSVVTRQRLSGTLRAIGMSNRSLGLTFALEHLVVASVGIAVGAFAGLLTSRDIVRLIFMLFESGTFSFPTWSFLGLILAIYGVIALAVTVPVMLAVKTNPAEALRSPE